MLSLPLCSSKPSLTSPICRNLNHVSGALANLVLEVLTLAALAWFLGEAAGEPSVVDTECRALLRKAQVGLYTRSNGNCPPGFPTAGSSW